MANVAVIGAGTWGCALASTLSDNGHNVTLWAYLEKEADAIKNNHECPNLPGQKLSEKISVTTDIGEASKGRDLLVFAVPSVATRSTAKNVAPFIENGDMIVTVSKGIEESTLMTQCEIIQEEIPNANVGVLSGPTHAEEVIRKIPTAIVAGAADKKLALFIQELFMNDYFRVYTSDDVQGIELGGSLKNVIALAAGMSDGLGAGDNTRAALMTRGIKEISELALAMGANPETLAGLSGIGDLIVTCSSVHSRNHRAGELIGQGYTYEEAMEKVAMVVEGVYSAKAAKALGEKYKVELPIINAVNKVLFEGLKAKDGMYELMHRNKKAEYDN
ncbi:MAG: NAD(P)-dependent glycerol-3-phosphate dehydrogenase [Lachnospiraceae bacterium]|nr:NAD(P)-dependent glycerol-3-phosphate dehydrogenase [Lachnospiraceae bacterium]